jgi:uncharacterized protein
VVRGEAVPDAVLPGPEALPGAQAAASKALYGADIMPATVIRVRVKPNSRTSLLTQSADGSWVAQVKAPPVEGRANHELIALIAEHFHCVKAVVSIKSGASGRMKIVKIAAR